MNPIQIAIIAFVVIVILLTLGYYWYDDARFKKKVEDNFNQETKDVLTDKHQPTVLDSIDASKEDYADKIIQKDVAKAASVSHDPLMDIPHVEPVHVPEDSVEAFFVKLDKIEFNFAGEISRELDLVIDLVFEEPRKLKVLPQISQFTHKHHVFYVLDKDNVWQLYEKGKKYVAKSLKLVVQIVDREGVISQAQVENIYNELHKFVINNEGHIRCSDYQSNIIRIQEQIKSLNNIELVLELYFLTREKQRFTELTKFFKENNLVENNGQFDFIEQGSILYSIANETNGALEKNAEYSTLSIVAKLHLHQKPQYVVDNIFDLAERFMAKFESRILTANKQVIGQREYDQLQNFVKNYSDSAEKKHIKLGSPLIRRIFNS